MNRENLFQNNVDVNKRSKGGRTALHYAFIHKNEELKDYFINNGVDKEIKDYYGLKAEEYTIQKPTDFVGDFIKAAQEGKIRSVMYSVDF